MRIAAICASLFACPTVHFWKAEVSLRTLELEYGSQSIEIRIPDSAVVRSLPDTSPLPPGGGAINAALARPLNSPPFAELARQRRQSIGPNCRALIVVSDNTRPVPYRGSDSILIPIIDQLVAVDIRQIDVLVAAGTHRALSEAELKSFLPDRLWAGDIRLLQHDCTDSTHLRRVGVTPRGTEAWINTHYLDADLKIITGLVEPHFMAGASGGSKSICPGIAGEKVTYEFHGAAMMADPLCQSLNLTDNPCLTESRAVAALAGCDFTLNCTVNRRRELTGVWGGAMCQVHAAACAAILADSTLVIPHAFDAVLSHAGFVGVNHYQAGKAGVEAVRAVKPGGTLILFACHSDPDPIGSARYKKVLALLKQLGPDGLDAHLLSPDWTFIPEQWQPQMWGRVLRKLGPTGRLIYCAPQVTGALFETHALPGMDGGAGLCLPPDPRQSAEQMVQRAIDRLSANKTLLILEDGPYGIPLINPPPEK
jgi:nickel-dependent lactate racemase